MLGRWGDGSEFPLVIDIIRNLCGHADKIRNGITIYLGLRAYPAVLILTAYGLGLTRAEPDAGSDAARQVYIANTLKCRPPRNRNPAPDEMALCEPRARHTGDDLRTELAAARPRSSAPARTAALAALALCLLAAPRATRAAPASPPPPAPEAPEQ